MFNDFTISQHIFQILKNLSLSHTHTHNPFEKMVPFNYKVLDNLFNFLKETNSENIRNDNKERKRLMLKITVQKDYLDMVTTL